MVNVMAKIVPFLKICTEKHLHNCLAKIKHKPGTYQGTLAATVNVFVDFESVIQIYWTSINDQRELRGFEAWLIPFTSFV